MKHQKYIILFFIVLSVISFNCDTNKLDLDKIVDAQPDKSGNITGDTVYVKQNPDWTGFNKPEDIIVGREPFIYVADTYNDQIVMLNISGEVLGKKPIKHPVALAQDYQLNLIVCAQMDTTIQGMPVTLSSVFKIDMVASGHNIETAPITRILPSVNDLRYINEVKRREYTGVCVFYDNSFYISRKGTENKTSIDPDNGILIFQKVVSGGVKKDSLIGSVPYLEPEGTGLLSANGLSSLTSFNKRNYDVIITLVGADNHLRTQWLQYVSSSVFTGYKSKFIDNPLMKNDRFINPEDAAVDNSGNIYIADAGKDSVFKFNAYGEELQSFGGKDVFSHPHAVAVFNKTVYVADTDRNRILRFILSTDIN